MDILEIFKGRHQLSSTIITALVPVDKWYDVIGAILDRIIIIHKLIQPS